MLFRCHTSAPHTAALQPACHCVTARLHLFTQGQADEISRITTEKSHPADRVAIKIFVTALPAATTWTVKIKGQMWLFTISLDFLLNPTPTWRKSPFPNFFQSWAFMQLKSQRLSLTHNILVGFFFSSFFWKHLFAVKTTYKIKHVLWAPSEKMLCK